MELLNYGCHVSLKLNWGMTITTGQHFKHVLTPTSEVKKKKKTGRECALIPGGLGCLALRFKKAEDAADVFEILPVSGTTNTYTIQVRLFGCSSKEECVTCTYSSQLKNKSKKI